MHNYSHKLDSLSNPDNILSGKTKKGISKATLRQENRLMRDPSSFGDESDYGSEVLDAYTEP